MLPALTLKLESIFNRQSIAQLESEEAELLKELNLARSNQNKLKDKGTVDKLKGLKDREGKILRYL